MKSHLIKVAHCLAASLYLSAAAGAQEPIKPCVCLPCGGQIECQRGTTGWCECRDGKCHGGCLRNDRDPRRLAASVLTVIVGEGSEIRPEGLREHRRQYAAILETLLARREDEQTYRIEYGGRKLGFVFSKEAADQLGLVLFELRLNNFSQDPPPTPTPANVPYIGNPIAIKTISSNGPLGVLVLGLLLAMGLYTLVVATERHLTYSAARRESRAFANLVQPVFKEDRIEQALDISHRFRRSHIARVVKSGLVELMSLEASDAPRGVIEASVVSAMIRAVNVQAGEFQRRLSGLVAVGRAAPLVGLLGLVIGLFYSFQSAASRGTYNDVADSPHTFGGLFALAFGLIVGLSTRFIYSRLRGRVDDFILEMRDAAQQLTKYLQENRDYGLNLHG